MKNNFILLFAGAFLFLYSCMDSNKNVNEEPTESSIEIIDSTHYLTVGNKIVEASFAELKSSLFGAISKGGLENALSFCNEHAYIITDSLSLAFYVNIKRVALGYRNPENKVDSLDKEVYDVFMKSIANNGKAESFLIDKEGSIVYYSPILLGENCLKCHGNPETQIGDSLYRKITRLYPADKAINFEKGDLRGMWRVSFKD